MSELKITPGPWTHYDDSDQAVKRHEIVAMGKTVARIYCSVPDEDKANARLIAAAPDLLKALKRMLNESEYVHGFDNPCECPKCEANNAIAKVKGG